jgi:hypothetical protein
MTMDYNSLKRKIQNDLEVAKMAAKQEMASEKISKRMKRAARRKRAKQRMSDQMEQIMKPLESSPKVTVIETHEVKIVSKQHHFDLITPSRKHKMEEGKESRNSIVHSSEYPTKVDKVVQECNENVCAEQNFMQCD